MKRMEDLCKDGGIENPIKLDFCPVDLQRKQSVNIVALGDVGTTVLMGLRLLGGDCISQLGICDINSANVLRLEQEMNQIRYPFGLEQLPPVKAVEEDRLFQCDVLVFCASKGIPPLGSKGDVRMAQLDANREIVSHYGRLARESGYRGLIAVVSDPVDPLCKVFLQEGKLHPVQIRGYGLGVMNARALYYAEKEERFSAYLQEGRAFGPHGQDLVIANSLSQYDDRLSRELTQLTVESNMQVRQLGFKPYIAPALSSAVISILLTLRGQWHYSSLYFGDEVKGAFLGMRNCLTDRGSVYEDVTLPIELYERIQNAYDNLCNIR